MFKMRGAKMKTFDFSKYIGTYTYSQAFKVVKKMKQEIKLYEMAKKKTTKQEPKIISTHIVKFTITKFDNKTEDHTVETTNTDKIRALGMLEVAKGEIMNELNKFINK